MIVMDIYCDGGTAGPNPSRLGGAWCWCGIVDDEIVREETGTIFPSDIGLPTVSCNITELLAAIHALEEMPDSWNGRLYTDSLVTRSRLLKKNPKLTGVPQKLRDRLFAVRKRFPHIKAIQIAGHPTAIDLARGYRVNKNSKRIPTSVHHVHCDAICTEIICQIESGAIVTAVDADDEYDDTPLFCCTPGEK